MADMTEEVLYNPFDPSFLADPYRQYARLLFGPPRRVNMGLPAVLIARYADVVTVVPIEHRVS
jgi:hypothetical protein